MEVTAGCHDHGTAHGTWAGKNKTLPIFKENFLLIMFWNVCKIFFIKIAAKTFFYWNCLCFLGTCVFFRHLCFFFLDNKCAISPEQVFVMDSSITRGHNFKLYLPRTNLEVRKRFFSVRVIHSWNSLANDTVCSTSLNVFKCLLQRDLGQRLFDFLD